MRPKSIRILSATRTPRRKLSPFSVLLTSQEHGVLVASRQAKACLLSLRDRPAGAQNAFAFANC